jgi:hypothetical protein
VAGWGGVIPLGMIFFPFGNELEARCLKACSLVIATELQKIKSYISYASTPIFSSIIQPIPYLRQSSGLRSDLASVRSKYTF